jgi:hypothetical protein
MCKIIIIVSIILVSIRILYELLNLYFFYKNKKFR